VTAKHGRSEERGAGRTAGRTVKGAGLALVLAAAWIAGGLPARASADQGEAHYDRVSLHAERSRQVANDRTQAQLGITLENRDPIELQRSVNEAMNWGLEVATHYADVEAQTGGYRAHPVYRNQLIDHWEATQELRIESQNVDRITELVRVLQSRLQLQAVTFSISQERRELEENQLISEALGAFKERAELVRSNLGATSYRLVHVDIGTSGTVPAPIQIRAMEALADNSTAPALEPGTSTVTVTVDGTLELRK